MDSNAVVQGSQAGKIADATALRAAVIADGFVVHLFKQGLNPDKNTSAAGFAAMECDFTGYAAVALGGAGFLFGPVGVDSNGIVGFSSSEANYQMTDAVAPNTIGGFWAQTTAGAVYRFGEFLEPVNFAEALALLGLNFFLTPDGRDYVTLSH